MREFTREALAAGDGREGAPRYVAVGGDVYDASASWHWRTGRHQSCCEAGRDLTEVIKRAPHGRDLLERLELIGRLVD